jgi:hypothetical protein
MLARGADAIPIPPPGSNESGSPINPGIDRGNPDRFVIHIHRQDRHSPSFGHRQPQDTRTTPKIKNLPQSPPSSVA